MTDSGNTEIKRLYMAPIRGVTDSLFRTGFATYFEGFEKAYSPFVKTTKGDLKENLLRDFNPEWNQRLHCVPQVLSKDRLGIVEASKKFEQLGYDELNWNIGCPMRTSTSKKLGSGLLPFTSEIDKILDHICSRTKIPISIKTRIGLTTSDEIQKLIPVFNRYPIKNIIIHPRTGIQEYSGSVDLETFESCLQQLKTSIIYNGDICTIDDFRKLEALFPNVYGWMLGRGALKNPLLPQQIISNTQNNEVDYLNTLKKFHDFLYEGYKQRMSGTSQVLNRMQTIMEYLLTYIAIPKKETKKLKKSKTYPQYENQISKILR